MSFALFIVATSLITIGTNTAVVPPSGIQSVTSEKREKKEPIVTDRPDFTESIDTVPPGMIQLEGGFTHSRSGTERNSALGELLLRVPGSPRYEVRIGLNSYDWTSGNGPTSGFEDASLGVKIRLTEAGPKFDLFRPSTSVILMTSLPTGSAAYRERNYSPTVKTAFGWTLSDKWEAASNINYTYASEQGQRFDQWSGSLSFGYAVSDRVGLFFEGFTFLPGSYRGTNAAYLNTGITYLVQSDFQLDARIGRGVSGTQPDYFVGVGAAHRW